ncbi:MAG: thioredoxin family protein [Elusimicrobiota bacterium]|nr:thioredoxin family protein [Elusimicrobiota bacterium]
MKSLLLAVLLAAPASAAHVKATLLVSGDEAALRLVHDAGWHTYWTNPGDSGLAPTLSTGTLEFPAPERIVAGPLTSFGYSGEVLLPATLPKGVKTVTATWLECAEVCIPGKAVLTAKAERRELVAEARARLPKPDPSAALGATRRGDRVILEIADRHPRAEFFPHVNGAFEGARGAVAVAPTRTEITLEKTPGAPDLEALSGVLVRPGLPPVTVAVPIGSGGAAARNLLLAFLGGLLLNLMPCVFPVLAIKVTSLLERPGRGHALAYTAGVVTTFLALAGGLLAARAAGATFGWGFQLQSPWVVGALAALFVAIGLNLLGLFEVGTKIMALGGRAGGGSSFSSGVFAVVVAAPCTAPFMGAALGWALTRPAWEALSVFAALGLGTAAPYAVLASWPSLLSLLPRPGRWMETFKKALSVPMFVTAAWLLWVLWRLVAAPAAVDPLWKVWSPEAVREARASGKTVFVDFTAAWCLSCQVNERVVLARPEVKAALSKGFAFKADWTDRDPVIEAELARHGRAGVPLYIVYPKDGEAVTLPEILTPGLVLETLGDNP